MSEIMIKFTQKRDFQKVRFDKEQVIFHTLKAIRKHGIASKYQILEGIKLNNMQLSEYLDLLTQCQAIGVESRVKGKVNINCYYLTEKGVSLIQLFSNLFTLMPDVWLVNWNE